MVGYLLCSKCYINCCFLKLGVNKLEDQLDFWIIWLPEPNEGKVESPAAAIKNLNVSQEDLLAVCRGRRLGVFGSEFRKDSIKLSSWSELKKHIREDGCRLFNSLEELNNALDEKSLKFKDLEWHPYRSLPVSNSQL